MKKYLNNIYSGSLQSYCEELKQVLNNNEKRFIVTVNPETIMTGESDKALNKLLISDNVSLVPDGIAIVKACKKLDIPVAERITGIDIATYLLKEANIQNKSLYLFGAKEEVMNTLVEKINIDYPNINLLGYSHGYVKNRDKVFEKIIKVKPDICLVALGIPEQEKIIYKYINKFDKGIFVGVGGSFDVLSGAKKRAPKIFIKLNLEWLYRIIKEPSRLKRFYNNNIKFLFKLKK